MKTTDASSGAARGSAHERLVRLYRPVQFLAVALTALTVGVGAWAAATLSDPMVIHWTVTAGGGLVGDRTADPLLGSLLLPALAVGTLLVTVSAARLATDRAVGSLAYALATLVLCVLSVSQAVLVVLNVG